MGNAMFRVHGVSRYLAVHATAEEHCQESDGMLPAGMRLRRPCAAAAAVLLATAAAASLQLFRHGHHLQAATALRGSTAELEEAAPISFMATSYGGRGCPSGTVSVPSLELCKRYAASVRGQGLCAKHEGYGPDCDGPSQVRAPWCSARPLGCWQSRNGCTYYKDSGTDEPQSDVRPICQVVGRGPPARDSLYCISLLATSVDHQLLSMQQREGLGVFACDNQTIYSEAERELTPGTLTAAVHSKALCRQAGASVECFNARTFIEVWKHVLSTGVFRRYAWTLKVDADAVFLPDRIHAVLHRVWDPPRGIYVVNCRKGDHFDLHGSFESFSRNALEVYGKRSHFCLEGPGRLQFDYWSEALYMDECMKKLGVYRRLDETFLLAPGCSAWNMTSSRMGERATCEHRSYIAFHPFQREQAYRECAGTAGQGVLS